VNSKEVWSLEQYQAYGAFKIETFEVAIAAVYVSTYESCNFIMNGITLNVKP